MPFPYSYTRELLPEGAYDIDNPNRVDGEGKQIYLAKEVEPAFPGKHFRVVCDEDSCDIIFEEELDSGEQAVLTQKVNEHKANA